MTPDSIRQVDTAQDLFRSLLAEFRGKLEGRLQQWLTEKETEAAAESGASRELTEVLTRFVARDGKRIRPALLYYTMAPAVDIRTTRSCRWPCRWSYCIPIC
jgi:geranylgeranyl pyrophosphate synthase